MWPIHVVGPQIRCLIIWATLKYICCCWMGAWSTLQFTDTVFCKKSPPVTVIEWRDDRLAWHRNSKLKWSTMLVWKWMVKDCVGSATGPHKNTLLQIDNHYHSVWEQIELYHEHNGHAPVCKWFDAEASYFGHAITICKRMQCISFFVRFRVNVMSYNNYFLIPICFEGIYPTGRNFHWNLKSTISPLAKLAKF